MWLNTDLTLRWSGYYATLDPCRNSFVLPLPSAMPQIVKAPHALPTLLVFSQATISKGHVHVSGTIGITKDFKLVEGGIKAQTVGPSLL